jgi:hypothetical protein
MNNLTGAGGRPQERGAISIKALFIFVLIATVIFALIKIVPVYIDERQLTYRVDDLASKSAVRNSKEVDIKKAIDLITKEYNLPENSINLVSRDVDRVQISLTYQKDIDFLVTTYQWKVNHTAAGKAL